MPAHDRPVCGSCGATYKTRFAVGDDWTYREVSAAEYQQHARAAGWRIESDGPGVMCPKCARPDPQLVAICRDLERSTTRKDPTT